MNCYYAWRSHGLMKNVNKLHFGLPFSVEKQRKGLLLESTITCDDMLKNNKDDLFCKERSRAMKNGLFSIMWNEISPGENETRHRQSFEMWSESVQGDTLRKIDLIQVTFTNRKGLKVPPSMKRVKKWPMEI